MPELRAHEDRRDHGRLLRVAPVLQGQPPALLVHVVPDDLPAVGVDEAEAEDHAVVNVPSSFRLSQSKRTRLSGAGRQAFQFIANDSGISLRLLGAFKRDLLAE